MTQGTVCARGRKAAGSRFPRRKSAPAKKAGKKSGERGSKMRSARKFMKVDGDPDSSYLRDVN